MAGALLNTTTRRELAKPEARSPKPERNPNPEARIAHPVGMSPTGRGKRSFGFKADIPRESFRTTMPLAWIAERLGMGSRAHLAWLLQQRRKGGRVALTGQTLLGM